MTNITGSLDPVFCSSDATFRFEIDADCWASDDDDLQPEVECSCCTSCCHDLHGCHSDVMRHCDIEKWIAEEVGPQSSNGASCGTTCDCSVPQDHDDETTSLMLASNDTIAILSCTDSIPTCNSDGTVCFVAKEWGMIYPSTWEEDFETSLYYRYDYVRGRDDSINFEVDGVFVDGTRCNAQWTEGCIDRTEVPAIDCQNVDGAGFFDGCQSSIEGGGRNSDSPFAILSMQYSYSWDGCGRFPSLEWYFRQFNP